jgi:hypothetical protein
MMALKRSKFKSGQTVYARTHRFPGQSLIITLIRYIPNHEWYAEYLDSETGHTKCDYFDESEFD